MRESVAAAAELLGLDPSTIEEEPVDSKDRWGNDDRSAQGLEARVIGEKKEIPDFSQVAAKWTADWSLNLKSDSSEASYFEHEGIGAQVGYSWDVSEDGFGNVWAEAATGCFPAAEVEES